MLFGSKDLFAIEFEIKTLYHDESFIGCGFFVVYINNFIYGIREDDATTFGSILYTLKKLNKSEFYSETPSIDYQIMKFVINFMMQITELKIDIQKMN